MTRSVPTGRSSELEPRGPGPDPDRRRRGLGSDATYCRSHGRGHDHRAAAVDAGNSRSVLAAATPRTRSQPFHPPPTENHMKILTTYTITTLVALGQIGRAHV